MKMLISNWFRKVDIFPEVINQMGICQYTGESWAKRAWRVTYRDARMRAHLFCHSMDELIEFRGFGVLKRVWTKSGYVTGRIRVNNLIKFNDTIVQ